MCLDLRRESILVKIVDEHNVESSISQYTLRLSSTVPLFVLSDYELFVEINARNTERVRVYIDNQVYAHETMDDVTLAEGYEVDQSGSNQSKGGSASIFLTITEPGKHEVVIKAINGGIENGASLSFEIMVLTAQHDHIWGEAVYENSAWSAPCCVAGCEEVYLLDTNATDQSTCRHQWDLSLFGNTCSLCSMKAPKLDSETYRAILSRLVGATAPTEDSELRAYLSYDLQKSGLSVARSWLVIDALNNAPEIYRNLYLYTFDQYRRDLKYNKIPSTYNMSQGKLYLYYNLRGDEFLTVFFHESGHAIDAICGNGTYITSSDTRIYKAIYSRLASDTNIFLLKMQTWYIDSSGFSEENCREVREQIMSTDLSAVKYQEGYDYPLYYHHTKDAEYAYPIYEKLPDLYYNTIAATISFATQDILNARSYYGGNDGWVNRIFVFDLLGGMTNNTLFIGYGHNKDNYWYSGNGTPTYAQNREAFGNFYATKIMGDSYAQSFNKSYYPITCQYFEESLISEMSERLEIGQ